MTVRRMVLTVPSAAKNMSSLAEEAMLAWWELGRLGRAAARVVVGWENRVVEPRAQARKDVWGDDQTNSAETPARPTC